MTLGPFRVVDLVDMLLVAALVTAALVWVRKIHVTRVAAGLLGIVALYLLARSLGLSLLSGLFEGTFALFVVIAVVIFQKEIRRFLEGISLPGLERSSPATSPQSLDVLVETLFDFASRGIGALVVLPREEAIDRHISGGVELNGKLSRPLLYSLFDPHSPGHDGACVIEADKVTRFAVHLPLSTNYHQLAESGTRHAAALGLSEHCDALCLVVSEERHTVSIAREGDLNLVRSAPELRALVAPVEKAKTPARGTRWRFGEVVKRFWVEILVSVGVVAVAWLVLVSGSVETERTFELPVSVLDVPSDLDVAVHPERIAVTFRGQTRELGNARAGDFEVLLDAPPARVGRRSIVVRADDILHPEALDVVRIEPRKIELEVTER